MTPGEPRPPCYLAEWYRPELTAEPLDRTAARLHAGAASVSAAGTPVQLVSMVAVPTDEVLFGVFTAPSIGLVAQACQRAGIPAQRLSTAVDAQFATRHHEAANNP